MQKSTSNRIVVVLVALVMGVWQASAQEPERLEAVLRFDRAQRDTVAEATAAALPAVADTSSRIACKLNRRRTGFVEAYDAVTLWNVRRVKVKPRRMRLSDTTGREQVRLLKFFTERNRRKGVRPHLVGNAAGYTWAGGGESPDPRTGEWRTEPSRINTYSLRADYDSLRRVEGYVQVSWKPEGIWRGLPADALYLLDGRPVPGNVLRFIEGLTLRRLDIWNPADGVEAAARAAGVLDSLGEAFQPAVGAAPRASWSAKPTPTGCRWLFWAVVSRRSTRGWRCVSPMPFRRMRASRCTTTIFCRPKPCSSSDRRAATEPSASTWWSERRLGAVALRRNLPFRTFARRCSPAPDVPSLF